MFTNGDDIGRDGIGSRRGELIASELDAGRNECDFCLTTVFLTI